MPLNVHTATGPNGELFKRSSARRTYSHVVIGRPSYEQALARAESEGCDRDNFRFHSEYLDGTSRFLVRQSWERDDEEYAERVANEIERARVELDGCADADAYVAKKRAQRIAKVEERKANGEFDRFVSLGWCGRPDLAMKLASSEAGSLMYAETRILEATRS